MTSIAHPVLRGQPATRTVSRRRIPGVATGASWLLLALVTVLNMIGLVMVMSASSVVSVRSSGMPWTYFQRQIVWTVIGSAGLVVALSVSLDFWRRRARLLLGISVATLVAVVVPGVGVTNNGATRWLAVGPVQVQPSEFVKFALLLFVADLLARREHRIDDWRWGLAPVLTYLVLIGALIMAQPNLGTTIIIGLTTLAVLWAAGTPSRPLAATAGVFALCAGLFVAIEPFRRKRYMAFLNPMSDPYGDGLQNVQSLVAMANGGLLGRGLGRSTVKWGFLPFAWTDFIFAVIGEEFGMLGAMTVVFLFVAFAALGAYIASQAADRFSMLVAVGITTWISVQAFLNMAAVVGVVPITGVPLPFISYGGSSMLVTLTAVGMLMNIARHPASRPADGVNSAGRRGRTRQGGGGVGRERARTKTGVTH